MNAKQEMPETMRSNISAASTCFAAEGRAAKLSSEPTSPKTGQTLAIDANDSG